MRPGCRAGMGSGCAEEAGQRGDGFEQQGHNAGTPDQKTSGPARDGQDGRGNPTSRPAAAWAGGRKRARPSDGHGRHRPESLLAIGAKRGEEGSFTFSGDTGGGVAAER